MVSNLTPEILVEEEAKSEHVSGRKLTFNEEAKH